MALEVQNHVIGDHTYAIQLLGGQVGKKVFMRLMRIVAPAFEAESISKFTEAMTDEHLDFLCDTFSKTTQFWANENPDAVFALSTKGLFDTHFAGRYGVMVKWLWAAVETNYASFFGDLGLNPEMLKDLIQKSGMTPTPASPIGSSSASSPKAGGL